MMLWTYVAASLSAQRMQDSSLPAPPPSGFSDEDGVLAIVPGSGQRITKVINDLRVQHGFQLYVVLKNSLISSDAGEYASQLQLAWLPDGNGLVIVYVSDNQTLGVGRGLASTEGIEDDVSGVPAYVLVENMTRAIDVAKPKEKTDLYVETLVQEIGKRLQDYFDRKKSPANNARSLRLALVTVGSLSLLALCGMGISWLIAKADTKKSDRRVFPLVDTPERLSAPYGGSGGGYARFGRRGG